jgi:hypothetical protein
MRRGRKAGKIQVASILYFPLLAGNSLPPPLSSLLSSLFLEEICSEDNQHDEK